VRKKYRTNGASEQDAPFVRIFNSSEQIRAAALAISSELSYSFYRSLQKTADAFNTDVSIPRSIEFYKRKKNDALSLHLRSADPFKTNGFLARSYLRLYNSYKTSTDFSENRRSTPK